MKDVYLWCLTGMGAYLALNTLWRLWADRRHLTREDLTDEDRTLAWRLVLFVVFPLVNLLDLRTTVVAAQLAGGDVAKWTYGLLWYQVVPANIEPGSTLAVVAASGAVAQMALALFLLPTLAFRPHPFFATVIGYSCLFIFGLTIILDPLVSLAGLGSCRWQLAYCQGGVGEHLGFAGAHLIIAALYVALLPSQRIRLWFAHLSRPNAVQALKKALSQWRLYPDSARLACRLALLYECTGLKRRALRHLRLLEAHLPDSTYTLFLKAILSYRAGKYRQAEEAFVRSADSPGVEGVLRAALLGAAACSAFAAGSEPAALNLAARALEFDQSCLVARMVKVDILLKQRKRQEAGQEILSALRLGLTLNLDNRVPIETDWAMAEIESIEKESGRQRQSALYADHPAR